MQCMLLVKLLSKQKQVRSFEELSRQKLESPQELYISQEILFVINEVTQNQWKDPGTVLGCENKQILVKHGEVYIRVHACRLLHTQNSKMTSAEENIESENSGNVENKNESLDIYADSDINNNNEIEQVNNVPQIDENNGQQNEDIVVQKSNQAITATYINLPKANDNIE